MPLGLEDIYPVLKCGDHRVNALNSTCVCMIRTGSLGYLGLEIAPPAPVLLYNGPTVLCVHTHGNRWVWPSTTDYLYLLLLPIIHVHKNLKTFFWCYRFYRSILILKTNKSHMTIIYDYLIFSVLTFWVLLVVVFTFMWYILMDQA
jgi:hypothetical protein